MKTKAFCWMSDREKKSGPREDPKARRQRQKKLGEQLRAYYGDMVSEPVPDDFLDLLDKADANTEEGTS